MLTSALQMAQETLANRGPTEISGGLMASGGSSDETALPGVLLVLAALACMAMINSAARAINELWQVMKELLRMLALAFFAALVLLAVILFAIADRLPN